MAANNVAEMLIKQGLIDRFERGNLVETGHLIKSMYEKIYLISVEHIDGKEKAFGYQISTGDISVKQFFMLSVNYTKTKNPRAYITLYGVRTYLDMFERYKGGE